MSGREAILGKVRTALKAKAGDTARLAAVNERLAKSEPGIIPARGQLPAKERIDLFCAQAVKLFASVERLASADAVPAAVAGYLRQKNLPQSVRMGDDPRLSDLPWSQEGALEVRHGPSDGNDEVGVSHAFGGVAETGTVVMVSGADNPTTINFLPEHHIVVIDATSIQGDLETAIAGIRARFGKGEMPRTVNLISGPSRSGDIEQKLILGAHGPRALHLIVVGG
jgi:L-lactate dehydrogenase complex protein LldG